MAVTCTKLLGLVPSILCERYVDVTSPAALYANDLPSPSLVPDELHRWKLQFLNRKKADIPDSWAKAIQECDSCVFPNLYILLKIACTIPVTSCECERSFSALRRLHTYTRATMGQDRLSALALMHIHYDIDVDTSDTVKLFADIYPRRMQLQNLFLE